MWQVDNFLDWVSISTTPRTSTSILAWNPTAVTLLVWPSSVKTACCVEPVGSAGLLSSKISYCSKTKPRQQQTVRGNKSTRVVVRRKKNTLWWIRSDKDGLYKCILFLFLCFSSYQSNDRIPCRGNELLIGWNFQSIHLTIGKFNHATAASRRRFPKTNLVIVASRCQDDTHFFDLFISRIFCSSFPR